MHRWQRSLAVVIAAVGCESGTAAIAGSTGGTTSEPSTSFGSSDTTASAETSSGEEPSCTIPGGDPTLAWTLSGTELQGQIRSSTAIPDGGVALVGRIAEPELRFDALLELREPDGALRWSDRYGGSHGLDDEALAVAVDDAGFVHVLVRETIESVIAENQVTSDVRLVVLRYASDGTKVWRWELAPPELPTRSGYAPDGTLAAVGDRIVVLAMAWDQPTRLIELDRFGNVTSDLEVAMTGDLRVRTYEITGEGQVVFGGNIEDTGMHHAWIARFGRDGAMRWSDAFGSLDDSGLAVGGGPAGETHFAWSTSTPSANTVSLRRYDVGGSATWTTPVPAAGDGVDVAAACDGSVLVGGGIDLEPAEDAPWDQRRALWIARYSDEGELLWSMQEEMPPPYAYGSAGSITSATDSSVLVGGSYLDETGSQYLSWLGRVVE